MNQTNEKSKGALRPGTILQSGKYRIVRYLSQGGFGCTYEAEHTMLKTRVAIKEFFVSEYCNRQNETGVISVGVSSKVLMIERLHRKFLDEAVAQHRMSHPNIVRVIDVFEENSTAYYVMDYIDGQSLEAMLKERKAPLSEQEAVGYIRQVADALAYVHSNRRLHLDIKPGNIMIDRSGKAILIDFGASKQYDEQESNNSTITGFTRGYAPLEQIGGHITNFSPATDIFSLGSTLYRLLTGETPLDCIARSSGMKLKPFPAAVSEPTRQAVLRAMTLIISERPQSVDEFLAILNSNATDDKNSDANAGASSPTNGASSAHSNQATPKGDEHTVLVSPPPAPNTPNLPPTPPPHVPSNFDSFSLSGSDSGHKTPPPTSSNNIQWYDDGNDDEKKSSGLRTIIIIIVALAALVTIFIMINSGNGYEGQYEDSVSFAPDGYVDMGTGTYWATQNMVEDDGCSLLSREEVAKLIPYEANDTAGNRYKIPTYNDWQALRETCQWEWSASPAGYKVTAPNGNWIFLPADGIEEEENGQHVKYGAGEYGCYWIDDQGNVFTFDNNTIEFDTIFPGRRYSAHLIYDLY